MWNKQLRRETKENMRKKWVIIGVIAVVLLALLISLGIYNTPASRLSRQLDLGKRYLEELNYEQAVVAFNMAIEIDPRSADAYLGLADAYIGLGDEEAAYAALQAGYEATGDARIKQRMDEIAKSLKIENGKADSNHYTNNSVDKIKRIREIIELMYAQVGVIDSTGTNHLLSYEQIEAAYRPLIQELEEWIKGAGEESADSSLYGDAWYALSLAYLHLGEMEQCLETRREGYRITGWDVLKPESTEQKDEYGRMIESDGSVTYGEADREVLWESVSDKPVSKLEYDELGRIAKSTQIWDDGKTYTQEYEYGGGYTVEIIGCSSGNPPSFATLSYDEYGRFLNELEWRHEEDGGNINVE